MPSRSTSYSKTSEWNSRFLIDSRATHSGKTIHKGLLSKFTAVIVREMGKRNFTDILTTHGEWMIRDTNLTHRFLHARMSLPFVKTNL